MPEAVSVILHWNTDYAEIPRKELPNVVKNSYEPIIQAFEGFEGTICFNITGHTIDYLVNQFPKLIDQIKDLISANIVEMVATGYSHPILPLYPRQRIRAQVKAHIERVSEIFGQKPQGFWPPELAVSPVVLDEIVRQEIKWVTIDQEHLELAQTLGNDRNPFEERAETVTEILAEAFWARGLLNKYKKFRRALRKMIESAEKLENALQRVVIDEKKSLPAYISSQAWWNGTRVALSGNIPLYSEKKHFMAVLKSKAKYIPLYMSDVEFFGYRGLGVVAPAPVVLTNFLKKLHKEEINTISPSQIPQSEWSQEALFIGTGSWSQDKSFRIWTDSEDNREFSRQLTAVYSTLDRLSWDTNLLEKLEPYLRIVENSDARGWAPLPERKQEAYSALLTIFEILDKL
ncbi:MAG: polysaccharide deacetylase family protein [Promethearchaeota archaeon]